MPADLESDNVIIVKPAEPAAAPAPAGEYVPNKFVEPNPEPASAPAPASAEDVPSKFVARQLLFACTQIGLLAIDKVECIPKHSQTTGAADACAS